MATVTITIPNSDVADVVAAMDQRFRDMAIAELFPDDAVSYDALAAGAKGKAIVQALLMRITREYRNQQALRALPAPVTPPIT